MISSKKAESILIRGGRVIDPSQDLDAERDIAIQDGKIFAVEKPGAIPANKFEKVIDVPKGTWIMPGLIDVHVHLREPGFEGKETIATGTRAAAAGGFTSVACMANTHPVNDNPMVTSFIREKARQEAACRVFIIGAVTKGLAGEELAEIGGMVKEGAIAVSDDGMTVMNSYVMRKAMDYAKAFDVPVISHSEDTNLVAGAVMNEGALSNELGLRGNPAAAEEIMVARDIALCRLTRTKTHIAHISTAVALEHIKRAKEQGLPITAEVCPHHLTLTEECVRGYDTSYKMAPPLRSAEDVEALRQGLAKGIIDMIATDHAPHGVTDKAVEFDLAANGIIGLQTAVPVTFGLVKEGIVSPKRWVESLTLKPAQLINQAIGTLRVGAQADVTVMDPNQKFSLSLDNNASKSVNSPYLAKEHFGKVLLTVVDGRVMFQA
jgi:dihydroorotase